MSIAELQTIISLSKGPKIKGTKCHSVRLHDDKSKYCGIYARGGSRIRDEPRCADLAGDLADRDNFSTSRAARSVMTNEKQDTFRQTMKVRANARQAIPDEIEESVESFR